MNRLFGIGISLTVVSLAGYLVGVFAPYPGRSVSLVGIMAGITLTAIGQWGASAVIER